ncbi:DNA mismatch repair protein MSH2 [Nematocida sp. AWRm80]|nr:DNA mismatch repair protein MSH2 [Nematocida sp. AWRm80]
MVKFVFKEESYIATGEGIEIVREILQEKGEIKVPRESMAQVAKRLIVEGKCRVEVYEEINKQLVKVKEGSPGDWNDFSEQMIEDNELSRIASILLFTRDKTVTVAVTIVCTFDRTYSTLEFADTEIFTNLMHLCYEQNIKEAVYKDTDLELALGAMRISGHKMKPPVPRNTLTEASKDLVEKYLNVSLETYTEKEIRLSDTMGMNDSVAQTLLGDKISIYQEINPGTAQGKRLLRVFLRGPSTSRDEIQRRYQIVEELQPLAESIRSTIKGVSDIAGVCKKLTKSVLTLTDITKIRDIHRIADQMHTQIAPIPALALEYTNLKNAIEYCTEAMHEIDKVVDEEKQEVRPECSQTLFRLVQQRTEIETEISKEYSRTIEREGLYCKSIRLETNPVYGYYMRLSRADYSWLENKNVIQLVTQKAGILFTTTHLQRLSHRHKDKQAEIRKETSIIMEGLTSTLQVYKGWLDALNYIIAVIDVFTSLSIFANRYSLCRPELSETREYSVEGVFHPLLPAIYRAQQASGQNTPEITKNTLHLAEKRFCVITGPNMGGKTTFLKTIALISILAQIGSFVPATKAVLPVIDQLFIRIGASDSPENNMSTFMTEMNDISQIVNQATKDSLVIIDELGRGTSDSDGYAIAQAITEHIITLNCITLFATHFHQICQIPGVVNKRVGCVTRVSPPIMTYKIEDGTCNTSYGINVAKFVGFPDEVIEMAENIFNNTITSSQTAKTDSTTPEE